MAGKKKKPDDKATAASSEKRTADRKTRNREKNEAQMKANLALVGPTQGAGSGKHRGNGHPDRPSVRARALRRLPLQRAAQAS